MFGLSDFWLETRVIIIDSQVGLTNFHGNKAKKKNPKWPTQKNWVFQSRQFSKKFCDVMPLCQTVSWPYRLSHINALRYSYQFILLTQGLIPEIFAKDWELREFKNSVFLSRPFWIFFASFQWKQVKVYWLARMGQNFNQAKHDNTWPMPNILHPSVAFHEFRQIVYQFDIYTSTLYQEIIVKTAIFTQCRGS